MRCICYSVRVFWRYIDPAILMWWLGHACGLIIIRLLVMYQSPTVSHPWFGELHVTQAQ